LRNLKKKLLSAAQIVQMRSLHTVSANAQLWF